MTTKKLIITFLATAFLPACSNIPDKPVTEELTAKEVTAAIKSDSLFAELYDISRFRSALMQSSEADRFKELSYRDALKYLHYIQDSAYWDKRRSELTKEWNELNTIYLNKTDSVIDLFRNSISAKHIRDHVRIKPVSIEEKPTFFLYSSAYRRMSINFEISALQKPIKKLIFSYGFIDNKDMDNFNFVATEILNGKIGDKRFFEGQNFTVYVSPIPDLDNLKNKRGLFILPQLVISENNDTIEIQTDSIPLNIIKCVCINKAKFPAAYEKHRARAMQELFPEQMKGKNDYVSERIKEMKKSENELAYEFLLLESY